MRTRDLVVAPLVCLLLTGLGVAQRLQSVLWQPLPPKNPESDRVLRPTGPPLSLTSSDGTGLVLKSLTARSVIEDPLAFTELRLVFQNPQPRQIEGQFEITLPPGAAISRFAMRLGDRFQEGEVVELQAARQAYEDFLHRRQDPALLEKQAGNQFRARVFPIPPSGEKELILSYSEERPRADQPYRVYLRGLPRLQRLDIRAIVAKSAAPGGQASSLGGTTVTHQSVEVQKADFQPDVDFEVAVPVPPPSKDSFSGLRHENLLVARVQPLADLSDGGGKAALPASMTVLFDTSASRALGFTSQVEVLANVVQELRSKAGGALPLRVVAFDQETEEIFAGKAADFGPNHLQRLKDRRALGASDLERTLRQLSQVAASRGGVERILVISDGVATAGESEAPGLQKLVRDLAQAGTKRLDVIRVGGIHDDTMLGRLVTAGLPQDGVQIEGDLPAAGLVARLLRPTYSKIQVAVPGSQWVWPVELSGVQPGDEFLVYADMPTQQGQAKLVLTGPGLGTVERPLTTYGVTRPLLERAWVGARIKRLMYQRDTMAAQDADLREALKHQIVDLSTKFRVLSDFTALLVLETEADYERFKIDRRALTDIMTVGATGIELLNRKNQLAIDPVPPPPPPVLMPMATARNKDANRAADKKESRLSAADDMAGAAAPTAPGAPASPPMRASKADESPRMEAKAKAKAPARMAEMAPAAEPMATEREESRMPSPATAAPSKPMPGPRPSTDMPAAGAMASGAATPAAPPPPPPPPRMQRQDPRRDMAVGQSRRPPMEIATDGRMGPPPPPPAAEPYEGRLREVMDLLKQKRPADAQKAAQKWRDEDAGDVLALIGLGEAYEALGQLPQASRAYGSIIDLFPGRADLRRFAGSRLERVAVRYAKSLDLAADTFRKAKDSRPDHPNSHRFLAYSLLRLGRFADALDAIIAGATRQYPSGRFRGVERILADDVGLVAAAWIRKEPGREKEVRDRLRGLGMDLPQGPSLRFVLSWETDANDVDFHIYDGQGGHAYYSSRQLPSGGELYADVTTGYGPECFTIPFDVKSRAYPFTLQAHYYSRGPMGYGMGKLQIIEHDGKGGLKFLDRPFIIMVDRAYVDLGKVPSALP